MKTSQAPEWLRSGLARLEREQRLDPLIDGLARPSEALSAGVSGDILTGRWLGHSLHPLLTDLPLGCWIGSGLLDLAGGRSARGASQRLVGFGLMFVPATAASGSADWSLARDPAVRRVGVVHMIGNGVVAILYLWSWRARRRGRHHQGVTLGLLGGLLAWATGYLGGHMSYARGTGMGERGMERAVVDVLPPPDPMTATATGQG
jgi:uncharacterized membrane protein